VRHLRGEWLLVPLFVLPLLFGGLFLRWCRGEYFRALDAARASPPLQGLTFAGAFAPLRTDVPFDDDGLGRGYARVPGAETAPWRFVSGYPEGVAAEVLLSAEQRLLAQAHPETATLGGTGGLFRALAAKPDLARLRDAPLPASTKLYLARRAGDALPAWVVPLLDAVADCSAPPRPDHSGGTSLRSAPPRVDHSGGTSLRSAPPRPHHSGGTAPPRPPGIHACGKAWLVMGVSPIVMTERPHWSASEERGLVRVTLSTDEVGVRYEEPVAGWWSVEAIWGDQWWRGPELRRWGGPVAGAVFALLGLATALLFVLARRRRADEARVRFLTEIAHDLRTPITAVRLKAEMLAAGRVPEGKEEAYLGTMARETARLSGLLGNLLDLARLERGERRFERERVVLAEAAEEAAREFRALYPDRAGDLRLDGGADATATADRAALARCLANLLENAGKFTPPGVPIAITWQQGRIRVADGGPGIPPAERSRLFRRYARGSAAAAVPGTGLGLSLVRELAEGMGGTVCLADSTTGAAFELELPRE